MRDSLLTINIISSCNQHCAYCPIPDKWKVPIGTDRKDVNIINNRDLIHWLKKWADPEKWFIEITGGEPGLYPEINTLLPLLESTGYKGLVKTNGSLPIIKCEAFPRISAWHNNDKPEYYDIICIIKNPADDWESKAALCEMDKIPYGLVEFDDTPHGENRNKRAPEETRIFKNITHINSSGQITMCSRLKPDEGVTIWNSLPIENVTVRRPCLSCKNVYDVEIFYNLIYGGDK